MTRIGMPKKPIKKTDTDALKFSGSGSGGGVEKMPIRRVISTIVRV